MRTIYVENNIKNETVVSYIKSVFKSMPTCITYRALRNKDIRLNDTKINKDVDVHPNDKLDIYITDNLLFNLPDKLKIVYEDENMLTIYKPQGILSNIEEVDEREVKLLGGLEKTLEDLVQEINNEYKICHRLDRNTAGLVIFSKNDSAYSEILKAFKEGYILKEYIAYVSNAHFHKRHDILEKYLLKQNDGFVKIYDTQVKNSKKIITEYQVIHQDLKRDYAILKVIIHTGKTHQIRASLAQISHPIIGDSKYGKNDVNKKFDVKKQLLFAVKYSFKFENTSPLFYLNDVVISLDKSIYEDKIRWE